VGPKKIAGPKPCQEILYLILNPRFAIPILLVSVAAALNPRRWTNPPKTWTASPERRYTAPGSRTGYVLDLRSNVTMLPPLGDKKI
jgi:hypothetical protein